MATDVLTFTYKQVGDVAIQLDLYPPAKDSTTEATAVPVVVNFHGGGLTVGNTKSWFPGWLKDRVTAAGFIFISADYRLLPPTTGHDVVEDIRDLFTYIAKDLNSQLLSTHPHLQLDASAIAVSGCSAGGLCAYLAVMHAQPKPKAVVALYAMGGDLLSPQYLQPKTEVFLRGREMLDPDEFTEYLYPKCLELTPTSTSSLAYHGPDAPIPGYPANPRMLLNRLYLQLGTYLDYYTGQHEPSLSLPLRQEADKFWKDGHFVDGLQGIIPPAHFALFPQFHVDSSWPPTFLVHGTRDTAVWMGESMNMKRLLDEAGRPSTLYCVAEADHSLDYVPDAEELYGKPGGLFDEICHFIVDQLRSDPH